MSDIPKWQASIQYLYPGEAAMGRMQVYLASDVDAAVAAAEQRVIATAMQRIEALWSLDPSWDGTNWNNALTSALAAINALREKS
jgi:hypothetical protein